MRLHRRRTAAIVAAGVLAGSLAACAEGGGAGVGQAKDVTIRVATTDTVTSLDPAGAYDLGSRTLLANLYQTLLTIIPGKATPVPDAADCQFDTPTTYTCTLKTGQTFHNGHQLRSSDVKFTFERMLKIRDPQGPASLFTSLGSLETPDENTVVFNLKRPDATFPYILTTTAAAIVDEEIFPPAQLLADAKTVGSGPYKLTEYTPGQQAVLDRNPAYKGARIPQNTRVVVGFLKTSAALRQAVEKDTADVGFRSLSPQDIRQLKAAGTVQVVEGDAAEIRYWAFNLRTATARQAAVRRAVAQLVDRDAIVSKAYDGQVTPLYSLMPTGFSGHTDAFDDEYGEPDRAKAGSILRNGNVDTPVELTVGWTPTHYGPNAAQEAAELKRQLEASGLFKVTLQRAEWPQFQRLIRHGAYDLFHHGWIPDFPDGDNFLSPFLRAGGFYQNGYKSQLANRMLDNQIGSQNQTDRESTFRDLQTLVANDVPLVPTWQGRMVVVAGNSVLGIKDTMNPLFYFYYSYLSK